LPVKVFCFGTSVRPPSLPPLHHKASGLVENLHRPRKRFGCPPQPAWCTPRLHHTLCVWISPLSLSLWHPPQSRTAVGCVGGGECTTILHKPFEMHPLPLPATATLASPLCKLILRAPTTSRSPWFGHVSMVVAVNERAPRWSATKPTCVCVYLPHDTIQTQHAAHGLQAPDGLGEMGGINLLLGPTILSVRACTGPGKLCREKGEGFSLVRRSSALLSARKGGQGVRSQQGTDHPPTHIFATEL
jgi:hypothetical protein